MTLLFTACGIALPLGVASASADCVLPTEDASLELDIPGAFNTTTSTTARVRPALWASQDDPYVALGNDSVVISAAKHDFFMHKADWDGLRGWSTPYDAKLMMGRFLAGAWIMAYASPVGMKAAVTGSTDALEWAQGNRVKITHVVDR
jgi:hypothetical protein